MSRVSFSSAFPHFSGLFILCWQACSFAIKEITQRRRHIHFRHFSVGSQHSLLQCSWSNACFICQNQIYATLSSCSHNKLAIITLFSFFILTLNSVLRTLILVHYQLSFSTLNFSPINLILVLDSQKIPLEVSLQTMQRKTRNFVITSIVSTVVFIT